MYNFEPKNKLFTFNHSLCTPVTHNVNISEGTVINTTVCHMECVITPENSAPRQYLCFQIACCKSHGSDPMLYSNYCRLLGCVEADITADNEKVYNVRSAM